MSSLRERMMPRPDEDNPDRPSKGYFIEGSDPDNSIVIAVNVKQLHDSVQTTKKLENLNWESVKFLGRIFKENNGLMPMIHLKVDTDHDPQSGTTPKISIMEGHHRLRLLSERGSEETTLVYVTLSDYNDEDALQKAADIVKQNCRM